MIHTDGTPTIAWADPPEPFEPEPFVTYSQLRDFLDRYTNPEGVIQGDPSTIASEAVLAGHLKPDALCERQHQHQ